MRIAILANPDVMIPVVGYGGLERQIEWLADELCRQGHEVTIFGNVPVGYTVEGQRWTGVKTTSQMDMLNHLRELGDFDAIHDRTKDHPMRLTKDLPWLATLVWSDQTVPKGHGVYVSEAVRAHYHDPEAAVVPEMVPYDELPIEPRGDSYLAFGRIHPYKGTHTDIDVAARAKVPLTVAGHVGKWGDTYYALALRERCRILGYPFIANPDNLEARRLVASAKGLIHLHSWLESFSEVVAEALCHGIPVLTTDVGAPQEWVMATEGGVVLPTAELAKGTADINLIEGFFKKDDPTYWDHQSARIREKARELFDPRRIAKLYLAEYERVAA